MSNRQPPAKSRKPSASTYVIVGIIMVILVIALIFAIHSLTTPLPPKATTATQPAVSTGTSGDATPEDTSTPLPADAATTTPLAQAAVGTCFNHQATVDSNSAFVDPIDCTQPHDSEVFYSANVTDATYPDAAGWQQDVLNDCHPAFKTYTGITYGQNPWQIYYIYPSTQQQWDGGNHLLLCYTTDPLGRSSSVKTGS